MVKRIITSIIGLPLLAFFIIQGGALLKLALAVLALIGMHEFYIALSGKAAPVHLAGYAAAIAYFLTLGNGSMWENLGMIAMLLTLVCLICTVVFYGKIDIKDAMVSLFGFFYIAVLLSCIYLIRRQNFGTYSVWLVLLAAWGCDTGAYFTGRSVGKHKLAPKLSPNKTIEGAIGGTLVATVLCALYGGIFCVAGVLELQEVIGFAIIGFGGSIFAQLGDLSASAIKRQTGIKDFGKIFPGHGGVLDRFDSILFTAPVVYMISILLL